MSKLGEYTTKEHFEAFWSLHFHNSYEMVQKRYGDVSLEQYLAIKKEERWGYKTDSKECLATNLYKLCLALGFKDLVPSTHQEMCDFFVQKDPKNYETFEDFAKAYQGLKDRLLLVPRGGFKSSIDSADCVQWIICWPEVTILIFTGRLDLAYDFVREIRGHFTLRQDGKLWVPKNEFQVTYIDHCIDGQGAETEYTTPAREREYARQGRKADKEPTVMAAGVEQNLSGWHFGVMKLDDVITNENSGSPTRLASINRQININRAMLHPFGFFDKIGTWYDESDTYGKDMAAEAELKKINGQEAESIKVLLKASLWLTDKAKKQGKILDQYIKREDVELWFPERQSFEWLMNEWRRDQEFFPIKYLNDPRMVHQIKFPRELLMERTIPATMLPPGGYIVQTIDTAYSTKSWADYTVIITAIIYGGRFYIIDMVRGRFNEYDMPGVIAQAAFKWKPKRIAIEDSNGVRWLNKEVRREMEKLKISIPIEFISLGLGSKSKAKDIKAKPVVRLLGDKRMFFAKQCNGLDEIYNELEKFGQDGLHDDIVSGLSLLTEVFGAFADMEARVSFASPDYARDQYIQMEHDRIYAVGAYANYNANSAVDDNPTTAFQMENGEFKESVTDLDPLAEAGLFE